MHSRYILVPIVLIVLIVSVTSLLSDVLIFSWSYSTYPVRSYNSLSISKKTFVAWPGPCNLKIIAIREDESESPMLEHRIPWL